MIGDREKIYHRNLIKHIRDFQIPNSLFFLFIFKGELIWFNQASTNHCTYFKNHPGWMSRNLPDKEHPIQTLYGDGTSIDDDVIQHIRNASWESACAFNLRKGDVLVLDNMYIQHGRLAFSGKRRLLTSLVSK